jgi:hypothetical protein
LTQQEAMDELKTIVDVDKYKSLSSVKPAMLRSYGRIGEVPFNQSLIALSSMLSIVKQDKNPLARQLEVDLKSMISIINGVED